MTQMPPIADKILDVSRQAGPAYAAAAHKAVQRALGTGTDSAPDLKRRTLEKSMMLHGIEAMGAYSPEAVALRTKKRMRKDGQLRLALATTKSPILSAPFYFDTRSKELSALLDEVFIRTNLVRTVLRSSLNAVDYGFQNHETLWDTQDVKTAWDVPNEAGGVDTEEKEWKTVFVPHRFKDLDPAKVTILKDKWGDMKGSVYGTAAGMAPEQIMQAIRGGKLNVLDPRKMFLFVPILESQNYYGEGRLDWAYDPWYWQQILYMIALRWYERKADPPYAIYAPTMTQMPDPLQDGSEEFDENAESHSTLVLAAQAVAKLRSTGEIALPSEVFMDDEGRPSTTRAWQLEEIAVKDMHPAFIDMIDHLDKKKTRSVWASDIALSRDRQVGSLGTPEQVADAIIEIQNDVLNGWVDAFNEQILAPFMEYNGVTDNASLVSTGVLKDNRGTLKELLIKMIEADMLAEQAHGRIFPLSYTQMIDREKIARELGVPHKKPDPDAPMPVPPPPKPEPTQEARDGRDKISNKQVGGPPAANKLKSGLAIERGFDVADYTVEAAAQRHANEMEAWVEETARNAPARDTLETHEKAIIAIMLWYLLRSPKKKGTKKVGGSTDANKLVFADGGRTFLGPVALAAAVPELTKMVAKYEGQGFTLNAAGSSAHLARARKGITTTLGGLRQATLDGMPVREYLYSAIERARMATRDVMLQTNAGTYVDLVAVEMEAIVQANTDGLLLNIENIAIRNSQRTIEMLIMGTGTERGLAVETQMGIVEDVLDFQFNTLYSDLTLEAHLRAAYRGAMVAASTKNGLRHFVKIPALQGFVDEYGPYDYVAASIEWWNDLGERLGHPKPASAFGLHHGSKSYWYPVPLGNKVRTPLP